MNERKNACNAIMLLDELHKRYAGCRETLARLFKPDNFGANLGDLLREAGL